MLAVRVAVLAAGGGLVAVPSAAHADNPPGSSETSGAVAGFPGYTWDVIVDGAGNATVTVIGPAAIPSAPVWASFDGGAWYYTNMYDPTGGSMWTLADPSQLPPFLNPDVDPTDYGSFIMQILPSLSPQPLPDSRLHQATRRPSTPPTRATILAHLRAWIPVAGTRVICSLTRAAEVTEVVAVTAR